MDIKEHVPGSFCWVELVTSKGAAGKAFYESLFGWGFHDMPIGPDEVYSMVLVEDKVIGAIYTMTPKQKAQNLSPHWLSYVSVQNADDTADRARQLGAEILHGPNDVSTAGRMAMLRDPSGAVFALWQPKEHIGAAVAGAVHAPCWQELLTHDIDEMTSFYTRLFGWDTKVDDKAGFRYTEFMVRDRPVGGMMAIQKEWGPVPPNWMVYFAVDDCDASFKKAEGLGAAVSSPPCDIPGVGRFATFRDPQSASFSIIRLDLPRS